MANRASTHHWGSLTWQQIADLDRDTTVLLLATGAIEQHGPHLPVNTDIVNSSTLIETVAAQWRGTPAAPMSRVIVLPPIWWGTSPHHKSYPGTISLRLETFHHLLVDTIDSISRHGFYRFLIVNGHGGNAGILAASTGDISESLGVSVATYSYWNTIAGVLRELGESELGGMGHACEMETSLALHLNPASVDSNALHADLPTTRLPVAGIDFRRPGTVGIALDFGRDTRDGVMGDPTAATPEKGRAFFEAAVTEATAIVCSLLTLDRHSLTTERFAQRLDGSTGRRTAGTPPIGATMPAE